MEFENKGMAANMLSDEITGILRELKLSKCMIDDIINAEFEEKDIHPSKIIHIVDAYKDVIWKVEVLNDYLCKALNLLQELDALGDWYFNAKQDKTAPAAVATAENDLDAELLELLQAAADNDGLVSSKKLLALSRRLRNKEDCDV